jgi:hypothetical protein
MTKYKCVHTFTSGSTSKLYVFGDIIESEERDMLQGFEPGNFVISTEHLPYQFSTEYRSPVKKEEVKLPTVKVNPKAGEMKEDGNNIIFE